MSKTMTKTSTLKNKNPFWPLKKENVSNECKRTAGESLHLTDTLSLSCSLTLIYFHFIDIWLKGLRLFVDMKLLSVEWAGDSCTSTVQHGATANRTVLSVSLLRKCTCISVVFAWKNHIILGHEWVKVPARFSVSWQVICSVGNVHWWMWWYLVLLIINNNFVRIQLIAVLFSSGWW